MSPKCQNCGNHCTKDYVRVFAPNGVDDPRVCPECEDKIREGAEVRDARAYRGTRPVENDDETAADGGRPDWGVTDD